MFLGLVKMLGVIFFFHFYEKVQRSVTYCIYCHITTNLTTRKRDSCLQHMDPEGGFPYETDGDARRLA